MGDYEKYKTQLEQRFDQDLKAIVMDKYISKGLGPSMSAKQLGIPRQAFVYFVDYYNLKELKYPAIKSKY